MKITVSFNLTQPQVYDWATFYNQRAYSKLEKFGIAAFGLMIGAANLLLPGASRLVGIVGLLFAAMPFLAPLLMARKVAATLGTERFVQYELDDERVGIYSGSDKNIVEWKAFAQWTESPDAFFIIARRFRYLVVPKQGFAEPQQVEEFREFLLLKFKKVA